MKVKVKGGGDKEILPSESILCDSMRVRRGLLSSISSSSALSVAIYFYFRISFSASAQEDSPIVQYKFRDTTYARLLGESSSISC